MEGQRPIRRHLALPIRLRLARRDQALQLRNARAAIGAGFQLGADLAPQCHAAAAMVSQMVLRPTPKQAQTIGPVHRSAICRLCPTAACGAGRSLDVSAANNSFTASQSPARPPPGPMNRQVSMRSPLERHRAIDTAAEVVVFGEHHRRQRLSARRCQLARSALSAEQITDTARDRDTRPLRAQRQLQRPARQHKATLCKHRTARSTPASPCSRAGRRTDR